MKTLYIIKLGTTFSAIRMRFADFDQWTRDALGRFDGPLKVIDAENGEPLPPPGDCAGVVLTGSHDMVTHNLPWSLAVEEWIPGLLQAETPFLGICYGHQLLARAAGGRVGDHPRGREIGTVSIRLLPAHKQDPLLGDLPGRFAAHAIHSQTVIQLPQGAIHLAKSAEDFHQAFRIGHCAWGLQFHPEFTPAIMEAYIRELTGELTAEGRDVGKLLQTLAGAPAARDTTRRFTRIVQKRLAGGKICCHQPA